ncbi:hypothetical protein D3C86_2065880 [compost metagenome]
MRQDQVLLVADTDLVEGILLGDVCNSLHLRVGRVPRNAADRLQRDRHHAVVRMLVRLHVLVNPA